MCMTAHGWVGRGALRKSGWGGAEACASPPPPPSRGRMRPTAPFVCPAGPAGVQRAHHMQQACVATAPALAAAAVGAAAVGVGAAAAAPCQQ